MFPFTRTLLLATPVLMTLTACATFTSTNDTDKAPYYESSFNDHNRAPASLTPPTQDKDETLDPLYMRTQADYYFAMGEAYALEGNTVKAVESFKLVLVYDQNSPSVNMRLAAEYLKQGLVAESLGQAEEATRKDPKTEPPS